MPNLKMIKFIKTLPFAVVLFLFSSCHMLEEPVTKKEALAFGKAIEKSFEEKDPTLFNDIFDVNAFTEKLTEVGQGKIDKAQLRSIPDNLRKRKLGSEILELNGADGTYQLVKHYEKDNKQHLLFRMFGDGGLNYHDIELTRTGDKIKAADIFVYMSGETFTKSVSDVLINMGKYYNDKPGEEKTSTRSIIRMKKLMNEGNYESAKAEYDSLPLVLQDQKSFQLMNLMIVSEIDNELYTAAMDRFNETFPNEPNMALMMIDNHFLKNDYKAALKDVDQLDAIVNKDPFLDFYRGNIYSYMKDTINAKKYYERVIKNLPNMPDAYIELITLYIENKQEEKAGKLVQQYKSNKKFNQENLETIQFLYPDFKF